MPQHKKRRVSEVVARPTRTSLMYGAAVLLVAFWNDKVDHLTRDEKAWALLIALAVVNAVWVAVENAFGRGLLRQVPPTTAPVVDDKDAP